MARLEGVAKPRARFTLPLRSEPMRQYGVRSEHPVHLETPEPIRGSEFGFSLS